MLRTGELRRRVKVAALGLPPNLLLPLESLLSGPIDRIGVESVGEIDHLRGIDRRRRRQSECGECEENQSVRVHFHARISPHRLSGGGLGGGSGSAGLSSAFFSVEVVVERGSA